MLLVRTFSGIVDTVLVRTVGYKRFDSVGRRYPVVHLDPFLDIGFVVGDRFVRTADIAEFFVALLVVDIFDRFVFAARGIAGCIVDIAFALRYFWAGIVVHLVRIRVGGLNNCRLIRVGVLGFVEAGFVAVELVDFHLHHRLGGRSHRCLRRRLEGRFRHLHHHLHQGELGLLVTILLLIRAVCHRRILLREQRFRVRLVIVLVGLRNQRSSFLGQVLPSIID